jgi:fructose/tagatose bisphosphate aldolase
MPIASPEVYAEMLDRAKAGAFAYPAINVTSSQTLNAALRGFSEAGSDGIVQVTVGGARYISGAAGARALAASRPGRRRGSRSVPGRVAGAFRAARSRPPARPRRR